MAVLYLVVRHGSAPHVVLYEVRHTRGYCRLLENRLSQAQSTIEISAMTLSTEFLLPAVVTGVAALIFIAAGLRTLKSNRHHYDRVRDRTGDARRAAVGTVGHRSDDTSDPLVVHGMAIAKRGQSRVIVRNGKIAEDSIAAC